MFKNKSKILILVEGAKTDLKLMKHLLSIYGITNDHEIVSYNSKIYALYEEMFHDNDPESMDLLQVLKERESDPERKKIFDQFYSDILLIFDLDPQDQDFSATKIKEMLTHFNESTEYGKLYLNYPMVEAFYHMSSIPDPHYNSRVVSLDELQNHTYKARVNRENRNHDPRKFAVNKEECDIVIQQNIEKAHHIIGSAPSFSLPDAKKIFHEQHMLLHTQNLLSVLCTCVFFIFDYNPVLLFEPTITDTTTS